MKIEFKPLPSKADTYCIRIFINDHPWMWVCFVDLAAKRVIKASRDLGWKGSKTQAEENAAYLQELYTEGAIE